MIERDLRIFETAAAVLNFTEAAELLGMSQPNVTQRLAKLERELGVMLFARTGRSVELTPAGRVLQRECGRLFSLETAIVQRVRDAEKLRESFFLGGTVTAGSFLLIGMAAAFRREEPGCALHLEIGEGADLLLRLGSGELDLVLTEDEYDRGHFLYEPYCTDELIPVFAPGLLKGGRFSLGDSIRRGDRYILDGFNSSAHRTFRRFLMHHRLPEPDSGQVTAVNSLDAVKQLAQSGSGIAVLSTLAVENELRAGWLAGGTFAEGPMRRSVDFVYSPSGRQDFIGRFTRFCRLRRGVSLKD